jgi:hypothetical protein
MQTQPDQMGVDIVYLIEAFRPYNDHTSDVDFGTIQRAYRGLATALNAYTELPNISNWPPEQVAEYLKEHFETYLTYFEVSVTNIQKHGSQQAKQGVAHLEKALGLLKQKVKRQVGLLRKS